MSEEFKKILELILKDDWHDLLKYLTMDEIDKDGIRISSEDYRYEGDFELDARHTYPNRNNLIKAVIKKVLKCQHKKTVAINEEGHAGVYCTFCGEKLEDAC